METVPLGVGTLGLGQPVIHKHADGFVEFTDTLNPLAELQLGSKRHSEEPFGNFAVGEI